MKTLIKKCIPTFLLSWYHLGLAALGAIIYGFPSRKLIVIGITGTNGKSTVVDLVSHILTEAGFKVASLSSIRFRVGDKEWPNTLKMTMPGRFKLQKFLRDAVNARCTYAVLEVTSEGIAQWRHWGITFDVAVLTNLTPEHIERHGSFAKYREAKAKLFQSLANPKYKARNPKQIINPKSQIKNKKVSIVNLDDTNADYFLQFPADEKYCYTVENKKFNATTQHPTRTLQATNCMVKTDGIVFAIDGTEFHLKLHGLFNIYNALAAISVGVSQGVDLGSIKSALEKIGGIPGRFEIVMDSPFTVIVDYAHTPDALENIYKTAHKLGLSQRARPAGTVPAYVCVLGAAGGGRDTWKRPEFGKLAATYCDQIILTDEDPYDEDPHRILSEIESGIFHPKAPISKIIDRREAIHEALTRAKDGDTVVITGKGCEPWMMVAGGRKVSWDDRRVAREEFEKLNKPHETL